MGKSAAVVEGIALLGCPMCGSPAVIKVQRSIDFGNKLGSTWYWAKCTNEDGRCGISTQSTRDEGEAAELWNRRAG